MLLLAVQGFNGTSQQGRGSDESDAIVPVKLQPTKHFPVRRSGADSLCQVVDSAVSRLSLVVFARRHRTKSLLTEPPALLTASAGDGLRLCRHWRAALCDHGRVDRPHPG